MKARLEQRLQELRSEFESGQKVLSDLEGRKTEVQSTLLRISGAIQVLEELLGQDSGELACDDAEHRNGVDTGIGAPSPGLIEEPDRQV